jgi:signal transduction histidine kinase
MRMDYRRSLFLIAKEAIHNALKHADCTELEVSMRGNAKRIEFSIADNGVGLQAVRQRHPSGTGSGLTSMRRRAEEIGGTLDVRCNQHCGTVVVLTFSL